MKRISVALVIALVPLTLLVSAQNSNRSTAASFNVVESTIPAMQAAMAKGQLTSRELFGHDRQTPSRQ